MSGNPWAEVDALNTKVLRLFEDGQPRTAADVRVDETPGLVARALTELTRLGYLKADWDAYTITLAGQGHLAEQRVAI